MRNSHPSPNLKRQGDYCRKGYLYLMPFAYSALLLSLLLLPIFGSHLSVQSQGVWAHNLFEYFTSIVPLYDTRLNKGLYFLLLFSIGVVGFLLVLIRSNRNIFLTRSYKIIHIGFLFSSILVAVYFGLDAKSLADQPTIYIFISMFLTLGYALLQTSQRLSFFADGNKAQSLFMVVAVLIIAVFIYRMGYVTAIEPQAFIFNVDAHMAGLIGPAFRLLDGYPWISRDASNVYDLSYSLLMPKLVLLQFSSSSFSLEACMIYLQHLQLILVLFLGGAMWLRTRSFIWLVIMLISLLFFDPAAIWIYTPNHGAWRYLGVGFSFFVLSIACFRGIRLQPYLKALLGANAFLINYETGLVIIVALFLSELLSQKLKPSRIIIFTGTVIASIFVASILIVDTPLTVFLPLLFEYILKIIWGNGQSGMGGEQYNVIPVFAIIVLHCSIVVWRTALSRIKSPKQDFDLIASLFCLGWSMYFINRPSIIYLAVILIIYIFLFVRIKQDFKWAFRGVHQDCVIGLLVLCSFVFFNQFVVNVDGFRKNLSQQLEPLGKYVEVNKITQTKSMRPIELSAIELSNFVKVDNAYITPFSFFVRAISGVKNNLETRDPFTGLLLKTEITSFLNGSLPYTIFMPRLEVLFHPAGPPGYYKSFHERVISTLKKRGYKRKKMLEFWIIYEYNEKVIL